MLSKPLVEPLNQHGFVAKGSSAESATKMIGDEAAAGLTTKAKAVLVLGSILGLLNDKGKVNAESLIALRSSARVIGRARRLMHLGSHASGALVHF